MTFTQRQKFLLYYKKYYSSGYLKIAYPQFSAQYSSGKYCKCLKVQSTFNSCKGTNPILSSFLKNIASNTRISFNKREPTFNLTMFLNKKHDLKIKNTQLKSSLLFSKRKQKFSSCLNRFNFHQFSMNQKIVINCSFSYFKGLKTLFILGPPKGFKKMFVLKPCEFNQNSQIIKCDNLLKIKPLQAFYFYTYQQKWNYKFMLTYKNSTSLNETNINKFTKRKQFITNSLKGILLVNFPEKEKTFLIKNLAAENKITLIRESAGLLLKNSENLNDLLSDDDPIQDLFDKVKTCIPCICFINHLDRIGKQRSEQEQKSLHWLNDSILFENRSLLMKDRKSTPVLDSPNPFPIEGFSTTNKDESMGALNKKLSVRPAADKQNISRFNRNRVKGNREKTTASLKLFGYHVKNHRFAKTSHFKNHRFAKHNNQKVLAKRWFLTWYSHGAQKNKHKYNLFFKDFITLSLGSENSIRINNKTTASLFYTKKKIPSIINLSSRFSISTTPLNYTKLSYDRCFLKKMCYSHVNTLNETSKAYRKNNIELTPLNCGYFLYLRNSIWNRYNFQILKQWPMGLQKPEFGSIGSITNASLFKRNALNIIRNHYDGYYHRFPFWLFRITNHQIGINQAKFFYYNLYQNQEKNLSMFALLQTNFSKTLNTNQPIFSNYNSKIIPKTVKNIFTSSNKTFFDNSLTSIKMFENLEANQNKENFGLKINQFLKNQKPVLDLIQTNSVIDQTVLNDDNNKIKKSYRLSTLEPKPNKNDSFNLTKTHILKRTALLKFLQILDGFYTTTIKQKKNFFSYLKPFKPFNLREIVLTGPKKIKSKHASLKVSNKHSLFNVDHRIMFSQKKNLAIANRKSMVSKNYDFENFNKKKSFNQPLTIQPFPLSKKKMCFIYDKTEFSEKYGAYGSNKQNGLGTPVFWHMPKHGRVCFWYVPKTKHMQNTATKPFKRSQTALKFGLLYKSDSNYRLPKKNTRSVPFEFLSYTASISKWENVLKNQPSLKSLNLLSVWPFDLEFLFKPFNNSDGTSYILPEYFQLLGHGLFLKKQAVTIIASTNNLTTLDTALLRPGRFDTIINFSSFASNYKSLKVLKHSPSLTQNKVFYLSKLLIIDKNFNQNSIHSQLTKGLTVVSLSEYCLQPFFKTDFYSQIISLDIPSQSIPMKAFLDVGVFIQYKFWLGLYQKNLKRFFKPFSVIFFSSKKYNYLIQQNSILNDSNVNSMQKAIYILKYKIYDLNIIFINILQSICLAKRWFFSEAVAFLQGFLTTASLKKILTKKNKSTIQTSDDDYNFNRLSRTVLISKTVDDSYCVNQDSNRVGLGFLKETRVSQNKATKGNISNLLATSKVFLTNRMFLKHDRSLLFCTGYLDYKCYSKKYSQIILSSLLYSFGSRYFRIGTKNHGVYHLIHETTASLKKKFSLNGLLAPKSLKKKRFVQNRNSKKNQKLHFSAQPIGITIGLEPNLLQTIAFQKNNNVRLTKYQKIYKLKIKRKQKFFLHLHPFASFMLQQWPELNKSNKLKRHLKVPLVNVLSKKNEADFNFGSLKFNQKFPYNTLYNATLLVPIHTSLSETVPPSVQGSSQKPIAKHSFFSNMKNYLFKKLSNFSSLSITCLKINSTLNDLDKEIHLFGLEKPNNKLENTETKVNYRSLSRFGNLKNHNNTNLTSDSYRKVKTVQENTDDLKVIDFSFNCLRKIPRKTIHDTHYDFQTFYNVKYNNNGLETRFENSKNVFEKPKIDMLINEKHTEINNIILLKRFNLAENKKKEHNLVETHNSLLTNYKMCRLDHLFLFLIFYNMFFETILYKKNVLNTIKIFMPYKSLVFSHFLLSQSETHDFSCKNFEILIYNKFKNVLVDL